MFLLRK